MSTLVGHFVSSPREREKRERRETVEEMKEEMKEGQGRWGGGGDEENG